MSIKIEKTSQNKFGELTLGYPWDILNLLIGKNMAKVLPITNYIRNNVAKTVKVNDSLKLLYNKDNREVGMVLRKASPDGLQISNEIFLYKDSPFDLQFGRTVNIIKKKMPLRNLVKQIITEVTDYYPKSGQYDKKIISTNLKQDEYVKKTLVHVSGKSVSL